MDHERKLYLQQEIARMQQELDKEENEGRKEAFEKLSEIAAKIDALMNEGFALARKHDIEFYYHDGYEAMIVDEESQWNSSRC